MKDSKIQKLFAAARKETPPEAPFNFSQNVLAAIHRGERQSAPFSLFDELGRLFPRFAFAALLIISVCVATDFYFTKEQSTLSASVEQAADEWMFAAK
jgi:hypothetical protein